MLALFLVIVNRAVTYEYPLALSADFKIRYPGAAGSWLYFLLTFDLVTYISLRIVCILYWRNNSSVECKKVVSAVFVILWEKQFYVQISFVFHCFLISCFVHKNVNTLSWDLYHDSKCVILNIFSTSTTNLIRPKCHLRPSCIHMSNCYSLFLSIVSLIKVEN